MLKKIIIVHWNCAGENKLTRVEIEFLEDKVLYLYYIEDEDYELINNLRKEFGYDSLPRVK